MSAQSAQTFTNETLKQINATLQGYDSCFPQQDKPMAELKFSMDKSMADLKSSADKLMADKTSVDRVKAILAKLTIKLQDF